MQRSARGRAGRSGDRRPWKLAAIVGVPAAVALLAAVAIASGADRRFVGGDRVAACDGSGHAVRARDEVSREMWGFGASEVMCAWREQYVNDPCRAEAQTALNALRAEHRADTEVGEACSGDGDAGDLYSLGHGCGGMMGGGDEW